ncbi:odorant receptor 4-like isoform X1 [Hylaeus anthracinus]|uniref:odorant receptor 4-like isoform X1 n=2 Tax=Hylaeus anthracinus TaxID=313031 RepID=UPI0023B9438B|nr:odorant receptor 4-like isoform X1 [Hylaeus anthracinus]
MRDRSRDAAVELVENPNYEKDINYTTEMCRWFLKPIGVWPFVYSRISKLEKVVLTILFVTWFTNLLFALLPPSRYILFEEKTLYIRLKLLGPTSFSLSSTIKYCYLILKGRTFENCIVHIEKDWKMVQNPIHRAIMLRNVSISRSLSTLCAVFMYSAGLAFYTVMPFLSKGRVKGNQTVRPLIYPGYDAFFDTQSSPNYEIIYAIQCIYGIMRYSITVGAFSLAVIFVTHICGQIQIQIARLEEFAQRKEKIDPSYKSLDIIIRDHAVILRFSKDVEEALREICLTQIAESTLIMCLLEYYLLKEWENSDAVAISTYVIYLISFTFNILIFCYIGEILSDQCSQMGPASYEIDWYNLPPKKACNLILVNTVALYPSKLTAGKIIELSLYTFGTVLQTSIVYLNLLRTVADW